LRAEPIPLSGELARFWTSEAFPRAEDVRRRGRSGIRALGLDGPESPWAAMILDTDF
jgi:hypothetical protein